jgi:hypothetical protein
MANYNKMVDGKIVALTNTEQTAREAEEKAWTDAAPTRRMTELRKRRDALLAETDYMGLGDVTMSDEWKTYRQALRDITKQTPTDDALSNITFPTKPTE